MSPKSPIHTSLDRQFAHPSGILGSLAGMAMTFEHKRLHSEVVERLFLSPYDKVLEIGIGPGTATKLASMQAGYVVGIEPSREMVTQATRRNKSAIRSGRVEILRASAEAIPFPNDSFSVVFEVNSFAHWACPERGLMEVFRVLQADGHLMMVLRKGHLDLESQVEQIERYLLHLGFRHIRFEAHNFGHGGGFITAQKSTTEWLPTKRKVLVPSVSDI